MGGSSSSGRQGKKRKKERTNEKRKRGSATQEPKRGSISRQRPSTSSNTPKATKRVSKYPEPRRSSGDSVNICQRYITLILCVLFFLSLMLFAAFIILVFFFDNEMRIEVIFSGACIFLCANAMVLLRLLPINWFTGIVHAVLNFCVPLIYVYCFLKVSVIISWGIFVTLVVIVVQIILAFHLVVFRPGLNRRERIARSGFHAFLGFIVFFLIIFNFYLVLGQVDQQMTALILGVIVMWYILIILFIMLTPYFEYELREQIRRKVEKEKYTPTYVYT